MKNRIKSFLAQKANPDVDRKGIINPKPKKSISFNLESALRKCPDY